MISLNIEVETVDELFDTLQKLLAGTAISTTAPAASEETGKVIPMPTKGRGKNKPVETAKEEPKVEPQPEPDPEPEVEQTEVDELAESLEDETTKEPEGVKLTQDNVRQFAVRYANACAPGDAAKDTSLQDKRRQAFAELTKTFGVAKFTEIPAEQWPAVVEYVNEQRKTRKLPADTVTD